MRYYKPLANAEIILNAAFKPIHFGLKWFTATVDNNTHRKAQ
jgi:hypothetical protein